MWSTDYRKRLWANACGMQGFALLLLCLIGYLVALNMVWENVKADTVNRLQVLSRQIDASYSSAVETLDAMAQSEYLASLLRKMDSEVIQVSTQASQKLSQLLNAYRVNYPAFDQLLIITTRQIISTNFIQSYSAVSSMRNDRSGAIRAGIAGDILRDYLGETDAIKPDYNVLVSTLGADAFLAALLRDETLYRQDDPELLFVMDSLDRICYADARRPAIKQEILDNSRAYFRDNDFGGADVPVWKDRIYRIQGELFVPVEYIQMTTGVRYLQLVSLSTLARSLLSPFLISLGIALSCFLLMSLLLRGAREWVLAPFSWLLEGASKRDPMPRTLLQRLQKKRLLLVRVFVFYCLTLLPILLSASFVYTIYAPYIRTAVHNAYQQTVVQKARYFEEKARQGMLLARLLSSDMDLRRVVEGYNALEPADTSDDRQRALDVLMGTGALRQTQRVRLYDALGRMRCSTDRRDEARALPSDVLRQYQSSYSFALFDMNSHDRNSLSIYFPIRSIDPLSGRPLFSCLGYVEITPQDTFQLNEVSTNFDYLFDRERWCIVGTPQYAPLRKLMEGIGQGQLVELNRRVADRIITLDYARMPAVRAELPPHLEGDRDSMLITACSIQGTPWTLLNLSTLGYMDLQQREMLNTILMLSALLALLLTFVSAAFTIRMLRPIRDLEDYFIAAEPGQSAIPAALIPRNEFSALAYAFSDALNRIRQLTDAVRDKERAQWILNNRKSEAEIVALQSQMDSHLIYNLFASMKLLLRSGDTATLGTMLDASGNFLRNGLVHGGYDVPMEQEFRHAQAYLQIQQVRYGQRLEVIFLPLQDPLPRVKVPQYLLQPILENAIVHGMPPKRTLHIRVQCEVCGKEMRVDVENDGIPIEPEFCEHINRALERDQAGPHIGLANIQERIRLRHGAPFGLRLESGEGGTRVSIRLPIGEETI